MGVICLARVCMTPVTGRGLKRKVQGTPLWCPDRRDLLVSTYTVFSFTLITGGAVTGTTDQL